MPKLTRELIDAMDHTEENFSWSTMDVLYRALDMGKELTLAQAKDVLEWCRNKHDAEQGINWDILDIWTDKVLADAKKLEAA